MNRSLYPVKKLDAGIILIGYCAVIIASIFILIVCFALMQDPNIYNSIGGI